MVDPNILAQMEEMGADSVRSRIDNGRWPGTWLADAREWLKEKDQESLRLREASQAEQAALAREANSAASRAAAAAERQARAAESANTRATIALIIAAISMLATVIGIWVVHRDASPQATTAHSTAH